MFIDPIPTSSLKHLPIDKHKQISSFHGYLRSQRKDSHGNKVNNEIHLQ